MEWKITRHDLDYDSGAEACSLESSSEEVLQLAFDQFMRNQEVDDNWERERLAGLLNWESSHELRTIVALLGVDKIETVDRNKDRWEFEPGIVVERRPAEEWYPEAKREEREAKEELREEYPEDEENQ